MQRRDPAQELGHPHRYPSRLIEQLGGEEVLRRLDALSNICRAGLDAPQPHSASPLAPPPILLSGLTTANRLRRPAVHPETTVEHHDQGKVTQTGGGGLQGRRYHPRILEPRRQPV